MQAKQMSSTSLCLDLRLEIFKKQNPTFKGKIRDAASLEQLICLINLENLNALFIQEGLSQAKRLLKLNQIAIQQLTILQSKSNQTIENLKKIAF
jgi:hypothetical protein